MKLQLLISFLLIFSSCSLLDYRDFDKEMDEFRSDDPMFVAGEDFEIASGDSSYVGRDYHTVINRTPPTARMQERIDYHSSITSELKELESGLTDQEYAYYKHIDHTFSSNSDRIYFLSLTESEKKSYLELHGHRSPSRPNYAAASRSIASTGFEASLRQGMSKEEVMQQLGSPVSTEIGGDLLYRTEVWSYAKNSMTQRVYFTDGSLSGWE
ncbi:MAG: outer membrane protein assembly factor BamE [Bacteriovoracaceae bacterium]|nr:outer membrane protein assembly factor BamE [Bacteriovoracaceae bacterium]